jgi:hypothetical protein
MQAKDKPPQEDRVAKLEATVAELRGGLNNLVKELWDQDMRYAVGQHEELIKRLVDALLRPERCECGRPLAVLLPQACTSCSNRYERLVESLRQSGY